MRTKLLNGRTVKTERLPNGAWGACMEDGYLMTKQEWDEYISVRVMPE